MKEFLKSIWSKFWRMVVGMVIFIAGYYLLTLLTSINLAGVISKQWEGFIAGIIITIIGTNFGPWFVSQFESKKR